MDSAARLSLVEPEHKGVLGVPSQTCRENRLVASGKLRNRLSLTSLLPRLTRSPRYPGEVLMVNGPFHSALLEEATRGDRHVKVRRLRWPVAYLVDTTFNRDGQYFNVWASQVKADAEKFQARFGGEFVGPQRSAKIPPGKSQRR